MSMISGAGRLALPAMAAALLGTFMVIGAPALDAQEMRGGGGMGMGMGLNDPLATALEHREALELTQDQIAFVEGLHMASLARTEDAREVVSALREEMGERMEAMRADREEMAERRAEMAERRAEMDDGDGDMAERRAEMRRERAEMMQHRGEMMREQGAMEGMQMDAGTRAAVRTLRAEYANNLAELRERLQDQQLTQLRRLMRTGNRTDGAVR